MSRTVKQAYRKSRVFDRSCRNNGKCAYCRGNRLHSNNIRDQQSLHGLKSLNNR